LRQSHLASRDLTPEEAVLKETVETETAEKTRVLSEQEPVTAYLVQENSEAAHSDVPEDFNMQDTIARFFASCNSSDHTYSGQAPRIEFLGLGRANMRALRVCVPHRTWH